MVGNKMIKDNKKVQNRKKRDLNKGFGISDEDIKRTMAISYTIDVNLRTKNHPEPKIKS